MYIYSFTTDFRLVAGSKGKKKNCPPAAGTSQIDLLDRYP